MARLFVILQQEINQMTFSTPQILTSGQDTKKQVKISKKDEELKIDLMTINDEEFENLFNTHQELFDKIDNLID